MDLFVAARTYALRLVRAWTTILIALFAATVLTGTVWILAVSLLSPGDGGLVNALSWLPFFLTMVALFGIVLSVIFSILAIPFLMLRRFIVSPRSPYLLPGYAAVALYGPALLILMEGRWDPQDWPACAAYEAIALIATLIYVRLDAAFALCPPRPNADRAEA
jgi:hypothetical protein